MTNVIPFPHRPAGEPPSGDDELLRLEFGDLAAALDEGEDVAHAAAETKLRAVFAFWALRHGAQETRDAMRRSLDAMAIGEAVT